MPRVMKICKACGKQYEACTTPNPNNVFRWFDVACSRECAQQYIHDVMVARGEITEEGESTESNEEKSEDEAEEPASEASEEEPGDTTGNVAVDANVITAMFRGKHKRRN